MSFCRWSTDDYLCDLYVYASVYGGFSVNVAANRRVYKAVLPEPIDPKGNFKAWYDREQLVMDIPCELVAITDKYAGACLAFATAKETVEFLQGLQVLGYKFPEHVIFDILEYTDEVEE